MSAQQTLTYLFDAIALSFITIAAFDLGREIIILYKQVFITPGQLPLINSQPKPRAQIADPWLLPLVEAVAPVNRYIQEQQKPILLLAPAKTVEEVKVSANRATSKELLGDIDVDSLKLREARKLAKSLGIAQKINGKDQKLAWLRRQIKAQLQQTQSLQPEVVAAVRGELIAC